MHFVNTLTLRDLEYNSSKLEHPKDSSYLPVLDISILYYLKINNSRIFGSFIIVPFRLHVQS